MRILVILICLIIISNSLNAQVAINSDGAMPNSSAMLDVVSTSRGFLAPRMTQNQRNLIATPAQGLLIYQTDNTPGFYYFNGSSWLSVGSTQVETDPVVSAINGLVKSNGSTISSATAGVDYSRGTSSLATGILRSEAGTGNLSIALAGDFPILNQNTTGTASNVTGVVAIANGGTGSSVQNFVDLSTNQTVSGQKTWSSLGTFNLGINVLGDIINLNSNSNFVTNINTGTSTGAVNIGGTGVQTINIATGGTGVKNVNIGTGAVANTILIGNTTAGTKTGVNVATSSAQLHIGQGRNTAGSAPIKLTAGTNLTTPETGAVEFDGTNYYATSGTTRYTLAKTLTSTRSLNFPNTATNRSSDLTITLTGAQLGDVVLLGVPSTAVSANSCYTAWVSAANTVTVRFNNYSSGNLNPGSGTFRVTVVRY